MGTVRHNLAFYKRSGEPWTPEEHDVIWDYCGDSKCHPDTTALKRKFIFDCGDKKAFMYPWSSQETDSNFKNCKLVAFEDIFNEDGTVKGEQMGEGVVTVGSKKDLVDLLMSGGKWTSDEFLFPDEAYCYYDEMAPDSPFTFVNEDGGESDMRGAWNIKTWRKVKTKFKKYDLVMCNSNNVVQGTISVWSGSGVYMGSVGHYMVDIKFDHYEPYTGPVPKHIQDFIDEMKAKEK